MSGIRLIQIRQDEKRLKQNSFQKKTNRYKNETDARRISKTFQDVNLYCKVIKNFY